MADCSGLKNKLPIGPREYEIYILYTIYDLVMYTYKH